MTTNLRGLIADAQITPEALDIESALELFDFYPINTGGGCSAYERLVRDRDTGGVIEENLILCECESRLPIEWGEGSVFYASRPGEEPDLSEHGPLDKLIDRLIIGGVL